jgi:hypothetical protein
MGSVVRIRTEALYMRIRHCGICEISNITTVTCKENLWTLEL